MTGACHNQTLVLFVLLYASQTQTLLAAKPLNASNEDEPLKVPMWA